MRIRNWKKEDNEDDEPKFAGKLLGDNHTFLLSCFDKKGKFKTKRQRDAEHVLEEKGVTVVEHCWLS
jgi:hypothetical protein